MNNTPVLENKTSSPDDHLILLFEGLCDAYDEEHNEFSIDKSEKAFDNFFDYATSINDQSLLKICEDFRREFYTNATYLRPRK